MSVTGFAYRSVLKLISKFFSINIIEKRCGYHFLAGSMIYDKISDTKDQLYQFPEYIRYRELGLLNEEIIRKNISGAVAELGVFRGDFSAEINRLYPESKLYLFDTFEGFDENDMKFESENSYTRNETFKSTNCFKDTGVDIVMSKMVHPEQCIIRKGYFPDTAEGLNESFVFVSIDCDLYLPILAGLRYFYPRLINGGYIMIHDYNTPYDWQGVKKAVSDFEKEFGLINKIPLPDRCGSLIITK